MRDFVVNDPYWRASVKRLLRTEMVRRGLTYPELADAMLAIGVNQTVENLYNKISRGKFSAVFLLQALAAMGARSFPVPSGKKIAEQVARAARARLSETDFT